MGPVVWTQSLLIQQYMYSMIVYLLDFMSDFVYIDAAVICFLLIITVPTLKK